MTGEETFAELPEDTMLLVNRICNRFEQIWQSGERPRAEMLVTGLDASRRRAALRELIPLEIDYRRLANEPIVAQHYIDRFPEIDRSWLAALCDDLSSSRTPLSSRAVAPTAPPKKRRLGDYELVAKVGSGGMGTVYKAVHRRMQRVVALKVLRADLNDKPQLLTRFEREVRAVARLSHPNIVAAYDAREDQGLHYLITEFVDGEDLDRVVKHQGPLAPEAAVNYILQVAKGLAYAHQRHVIHRDIKPANLLLDRDGVVKILDMGLARLSAENENSLPADGALTESGMIMGTAAFMAPEQARNTRNADERSDIYSLGCTLYFLLTGRPVYAGETPIDIIMAHTQEPIPALSTDARGVRVPERLQTVFQRMVAKKPEDRYQQMSEVVDELEKIVGEAPTQVMPLSLPTIIVAAPTTPQHTPRKSRRRRILPLIGWIAAGLLAVATTAGVWLTSGPTDEDRTAASDVAASAPLIAEASPAAASTEAVPRSPAASDYALSFNGQDSYVAIPSLTLDPALPVTVEAIVQIRTLRVSNVVSWLGQDWIALFLSGDGHWGIGRRVSDQSHLLVANESTMPGEWLHLAATAQGDNLNLFVNGRRVDIRPIDFPLPETQGGLYIGGVRSDLLPGDQNDRFFDGLIDCVRISRGIRYQQSFAAPAALSRDDATLALYAFETGSGAIASDDSGNNHHGTLVNAQWSSRR